MNKNPSSAALEELTAAIVKAVPEIMAPAAGCHVLLDSRRRMLIAGKFRKRRYVAGECEEAYRLVGIDFDDDVTSLDCDKLLAKDGWEILGRPITLADLLRALDAAHNSKGGYSGLITVGVDGEIEQDFIDEYKDNRFSRWHLGKSLSAQSPETIFFLRSLFPSST